MSLLNLLWATVRRSAALRRRSCRSIHCCRLRPLGLEVLEERTLLSFFAPIDYAVGVNPHLLALGDFNGDGKTDLVTANYGTSPDYKDTVSVLLGNGDGTFQTARNYSVGGSPAALALGDFNGDSHLDLAVAGNSGYPDYKGTVSVLLGNGDGTFQAARTYTVGGGPGVLALGDFNGDGKTDLVTANGGSDTVSVLLGNGDGTFQPARSSAGLGYGFYYSLVVEDFNGDGKTDVVTANFGGGSVSVLLGNNDGTFQPARNYSVGRLPYVLGLGDFNGDGKTDLVTANYGTSPDYKDTVSVLLGNGDGTFQTARNYSVGGGAHALALGDFNRDGKTAIVTASYNFVSVLLGNGDGTFQAARNYSVGGYYPYALALGDFNGDGIPDIVTANASNDVSVLLGKGDGTFQTARTATAGAYPNSLAIGDFNGDGKTDLVTANGASNTVTVLLGKGDGGFFAAPTYRTDPAPVSVAAGDFNGDGQPDLVTGNVGTYPDYKGTVSVFLGNSDGTFQTARNTAVGARPRSVAVWDFNGDGKLDLALAYDTGNFISFLLGNGDGTFQAPVDYKTGRGPGFVAVGDFNSDGKRDLAVTDYGSATVSILLGNGDGTFQDAVSYRAGLTPSSVTVGDFNGDGKLDLVVTSFALNVVYVLIGNGDGTFQTAQYYRVGVNPSSVAVGDFDGDGHLDITTANGDFYSGLSSSVSVLLGKGDGTFQPARNYTAGLVPRSVLVGDFNRDGKLDTASVNNGSNSVSVLLGNGDGTFQSKMDYLVDKYPSWLAMGDFNGDGFPDLVVANQGSNDVSVLINAADWPGGGGGALPPPAGSPPGKGGLPPIVVADVVRHDRSLPDVLDAASPPAAPLATPAPPTLPPLLVVARVEHLFMALAMDGHRVLAPGSRHHALDVADGGRVGDFRNTAWLEERKLFALLEE